MELMAPIIGLKALKERCRVTVFSDSEYVVKAMTEGWAHRWRANGWKRNKKEKAVNPDLWAQLLLLSEQHDVEFRWVRGHAGDPENERCDQLALQATQQTALPIDSGYESSEDSAQQAL
jgi:ribonuclease HI